MHSKALPNVMLLGTVWGTNLVVSRFGAGQFDPMLFVGLRLSLASLSFLAILLIWGRGLSKDLILWRRAMLLGVMGTAVPMSVTMSALKFQSSGVTALLVTSTPAFIVLLAHFFLPDERLNRFKGLGVMLALAGALLLIVRGESGLPDVSQANPLGYLLVLSGMVCESVMAIYVRLHMKHMNVLHVTSVRLLTAAVVVMPLALLTGGFNVQRVDGYGLLSLGYAAFVGALAGQLLAFYVTERFGATSFSLTAYVIPPVAAVTGVILLDETITPGMMMGMALIGLGIALINRHQ